MIQKVKNIAKPCTISKVNEYREIFLRTKRSLDSKDNHTSNHQQVSSSKWELANGAK